MLGASILGVSGSVLSVYEEIVFPRKQCFLGSPESTKQTAEKCKLERPMHYAVRECPVLPDLGWLRNPDKMVYVLSVGFN